MKRKIFIIFLLLTQLHILVKGEEVNYIFESPAQNRCFTFAQVTTIATDRNNMLWFGCDNGLYYYNTKNIVQYSHDAQDEGSLPSNAVNIVLNDSSDRLWVVTDCGISYFEPQTDSFVRLKFNIENNYNVTSMLEYAQGRFLLVIDNRLYTFDRDNLEQLRIVEMGYRADVTVLYCDSSGVVYLGCADGKLYTTDQTLQQFTLFVDHAPSSISALCQGDENHMLVGYKGSGIDLVDTHGDIVATYSKQAKDPRFVLPNNDVRSIVKREAGEVWVGTRAGIAVLSNGKSIRIRANEHNHLPRNSIYSLHVDSQDCVWVGTWAGTFAYYNQANYRFRYGNKVNPDNKSYGTGLVHHFAPASATQSWIGSEWHGFSLYDHNEHEYIKSYASDLRVKSLCTQSNGDLWIGTILQGLYHMAHQSEEVSKVELPEPFASQATLSKVVVDEQSGVIWIGSRENGILSYNIATHESRAYNSNTVRSMLSDHIWALQIVDGSLLVGSNKGFSILDIESGEFENYDFDDDDMPNNCSYSLCYDEHTKRVYIATRDIGISLFDMESRTFRPFASNHIFAKYKIYNVLLDHKGSLWLSSSNGIFQYSLGTGSYDHFTENDGLASLQFHPASCTITEGGNVIFGSTNGFYHINSNLIRMNKIAPRAFVSNIKINNEDLSDENCKYIDSRHTPNASRLELAYRNNSITFEIVSNNMLKPTNGKFMYRLRGHHNEWTTIASNQDIAFTQLPFGSYILEIRSCNNDEVWGDITKMKIKIYAPFYLQWYALLLYLILILIFILFALKEAAFKIKAQNQIEIERKINVINKKTFDDKIQFFMNLSHDLRTPLSLIKAPLNVLEQELSSKENRIYVNVIKRNTDRMLILTNQILDFHLVEDGRLKCSPTRCNLTQLCIDSYNFFEYHIKDRGVNFNFEAPVGALFSHVDSDMIGKVLYNLLSNAFKYSDDGATITLSLAQLSLERDQIKFDVIKGSPVVGDAIVISIEDNGIGVNSAQLEHIFDRFYFEKNGSQASTGIGLHMCMEYVNLHNGNISVVSTEGVGSKFTIVIPTVSEHSTEYAKPQIITPYVAAAATDTADIAEVESNDNLSSYKYTVLIVDDNSEIRYYLKKHLSRFYNCVTARNGQQGFDMALDIKPSLIILDVMMPIMNGLECAQKLRERSETRFTPIIMLSNLVEPKSVVQGIKAGADAYLPKPIDQALLVAHVDRLIAVNVNVLATANTATPKSITQRVEKSFVQLVEEVMSQNLQNSMLDVSLLADELQMSRSTLQRNFRSEIDMGVAEYIRDYRLRSAVKMMENGITNVDELSSYVGFNTPSYFCKAFRDKYGASPKKYCDTLINK